MTDGDQVVGGKPSREAKRPNLGQALLSVSSLTFLSRILGLVRDVVIASVFAVGLHTDAFFAAFKIPNTLRRLSAEGAFTQAFTPVYNTERQQQGETAAALLRDTMASWLALALMAVTVTGVLMAPLLVAVLAPGFADIEGKAETATALLRITFPYILLISLTAFGGAVLNSFGRFAAFAFVPVLLNLSLIAAALWFAPLFANPVESLAWGVVAGGLLQLAWQAAAMWRHGQLPRPTWPSLSPKVKKVLVLTAQGALGVSIAQVSVLVSLVFASFLQEGSVSWLYFADRMMELPAGMIGAALAMVSLPSLSWHAAQGDRASFSSTLDWSLRMSLLLGLPAAAGLAMLALPIAATIFQHGGYTADDSSQTALAIMAYSAGVPALVATRALAAGFFSHKDPMTPVKVAGCALLVTIALNFALIPYLQHAGLALSVAAGATLNSLALAALLVRKGHYQPPVGWNAFALRAGFATVAMAVLLFHIRGDVIEWTTWGPLRRVGMLTFVVAAGAAAYFATLFITGWRPTQMRPPAVAGQAAS